MQRFLSSLPRASLASDSALPAKAKPPATDRGLQGEAGPAGEAGQQGPKGDTGYSASFCPDAESVTEVGQAYVDSSGHLQVCVSLDPLAFEDGVYMPQGAIASVNGGGAV